MTFRARLVVVAAVAVVIAVLSASIASYFAARNSLVDSVDGTLQATATTVRSERGRPIKNAHAMGVDIQYVAPSGQVFVNGNLPVSSEVRAVAAGQPSSYYTDISVRGISYRELVEYVGVVAIGTATGAYLGSSKLALQVVLPLTSVNSQLSDLGFTLASVAVAGIALALLLAWLVGHTALVPLNELTTSVEEVAETTDVSRRLDPGGPDELGRLRRAFNHLLAALERSREAQRQLVLDAGHELRTPLTSLRTNMEVVRRLDDLPPEDRQVLVDDLLTQMEELTNLVADLSELARGEQRRSPAGLIRLDLLVGDAVSVATTHGRLRGVGFHLAAEQTLVRGRRERLTRAVGNLLDNALKWSPDGTTVEVSCAAGQVTVRDHGPGIAADDLPHVFDRFYRSPAARSLPGSGLGLAIVAQVAEEEGGTVTVANAPDGGAVFTLAFPPPVQVPGGPGGPGGPYGGADLED